MDNKIFKINGEKESRLKDALALLLDGQKVKGWLIDEEKGFVLFWLAENCNFFPTPLDAETLCPLIWQWLQSEEGKAFENNNPFENYIDMDGSQKRGWLVYTEKWGHIELKDRGNSYTMGAVRPAFCWYGK